MSQGESDITSLSPEERMQKIQALREMVMSAERTIQSAKAMLLQFEGKKKTGRPRKIEQEEGGTVIEGTFDGQIMIGTDGKQYPVPANYASKSKLVEGDMLKLTITPDGSFVYKQIGPIERKHAIGIVTQDERGNYFVIAEGKPYRVLLASITYFKATPGDEVAIVLPRDLDATWAALESIVQHGAHKDWQTSFGQAKEATDVMNQWKENLDTEESGSTPSVPAVAQAAPIIDQWVEDMEKKEENEPTPTPLPPTPPAPSTSPTPSIDEWIKDLEEIEKEIQTEQEKTKQNA